MTAPECPRCGQAMEEGYTLDRSYYDMPGVGKWVEGEPKKSLWFGLDLRNRRTLEVRTFRCTGCGRLESFAPETPHGA